MRCARNGSSTTLECATGFSFGKKKARRAETKTEIERRFPFFYPPFPVREGTFRVEMRTLHDFHGLRLFQIGMMRRERTRVRVFGEMPG
jgi:hypothetical protein